MAIAVNLGADAGTLMVAESICRAGQRIATVASETGDECVNPGHVGIERQT